MKKLISLLSLPLLLAVLVPQVALAYTGVNLANADADAFYIYDDSTLLKYTDETTDAQDSGTNDITIETDAEDAMYFGFSEMFDGFSMNIYTSIEGSSILDLFSGTDGTYSLEYWNGAWTKLDATHYITNYNIKNDGETGVFSQTWHRPDDWVANTVYIQNNYYVRLRVDEAYSDTTTPTASQVGIIDYNFKVQMKDEFGNPIRGMGETDFEIVGSGGADDTIYAFEDLGENILDATEDGVYAFALDAPTSTDPEYAVSTFPSGFVARDPAKTGIDLDFSETIYESEDNAYSHVLEAENAAGAAVAIASADAGYSSVYCTIDAGKAYCPVDIGDDSSGTSANVYADGYIPANDSITNRSSGSGQVVDTITMEYGYIATVKDHDGNAISSATVLAGDDLDISCYYLGTGQYGCAIPLSNSDPLIKISATGYVTLESAFDSERSSNTSTQVSDTFNLEEGTSVTTDPVDDGTDSDGDGLTDMEEDELGTDDHDTDTDNDGISDGAEVATYTDPLDNEDFLADAEDYDEDCSDPFTDTDGSFAEIAICILYDEGIVQGRSSTHFEPSESITRAEFLKIALLNAGLTVTADDSVNYNDVGPTDWYYPYITYATAEGYVEGYDDGSFYPNDEINRAEAMIMMMRITDVVLYDLMDDDIEFDDVDSSDWFAWAIVVATDEGIIEGYGDDTFRPDNSITRAEAAVVARRMWHVYYE
ncbi:MAG: S-layer homology domain-containing protein [Candidatus Gracilibacteria bacterium]